MGKKGHGGGRGGSGPSRGRAAARGRGRGRGGGGGFQPFEGRGNVLGGSPSASGYNSPRGGYRGRGRGGNLSVQGQNRVGFDYSSMSRRYDYDDSQDDDDDDDDDDEHDEADFAIEPPAGYRHKIKPHLESDLLSDVDTPSKPRTQQHVVPSNAATPQRPLNLASQPTSSPKPTWAPRSHAPNSFPEFYTSRGVHAGSKFRPPEETEDSRYLAGIPGLRRPERRTRDAPRFGDPADQAQSPFRVPVSFVKATGEFGDPLKGNQPPKDPNDILTEFAANSQDRPTTQPADLSATRHAGLGFSRNAAKPATPAPASSTDPPASNQQTTAAPYVPSREAPTFPAAPPAAFNFDQEIMDDGNDDEVNALLAAFPGSKQLAPGESMVTDDPAVSWSLPAFRPDAAASTAPPASDNRQMEHRDVRSDTFAPTAQPITAAKRASLVSTASTDDDEEIILVPSQSVPPAFQSIEQTGTAPFAQATEETETTDQAGFGFVLDFEGEDPAAAAADQVHVTGTSSSTHRVVLGDAVPSVKSTSSKKKKQNAKRNLKRIPREGDSDLDWGSEGPPVDSDSDEAAAEEDLAAATAGISISHSPNADAISDPILAKAIRADRNEWESASDKDTAMDKPGKRRGGRRAKRSLAGRAAASRHTARSRKADQDAIVADYMQNIMSQAADTDSDDNGSDPFSGADMVVETLDGDLPPDASAKAKGKGKARRLSNKLDDQTDLDAMIRFMNGMDPQKGGRQLNFGDIEDEIHMEEVKEWLTESETDSDQDEARIVSEQGTDQRSAKAAESDQGSDEEDEDLAEQLRIILEHDEEESSDIFSENSDSESDDDDDDDNDEDSDLDDDDDDDGMFRGKQSSWADEDEEFIRALSSQVGGAGIGSRGSAPASKRAQKKLFHAISRGDFSDLMDLAADENEIDSDDAAYGLGTIPTAKNGKRKGRKFNDDDLWAEQLQQQWDKDRASKATKKQQRLMERQAAALNPFPNTHGKAGSLGKTKSTKKQAKLARKAEKREMRASLKAHSNNVLLAVNAAGSVDGVDSSILTFGGSSLPGDVMSLGLEKRFATNMEELNQQIQMFLGEKGRNTMRCQPMDKFARAEVHALAAAYNLQSKSKGKGRDRFPTLIKTSKSGLNVDYRKVKRIVYSNAGARFGNDAGKSDFKDKGRNKKGKGGGGGMYGVGGGTVPKNRDGEEVGFGADRIGADNIGHKLLAAMGWTEGSGIGSSQGMANPVSATVKTSRGGLGF